MYPSLEPKQEAGLNFVLFSEYGKNMDENRFATGDGSGERDPYNHQTETVGFNFVSLSNTRPLRRDEAYTSNLLYRATIIAGVADDHATRWFQNKIIHETADLPPIPRDDTLNVKDDGIKAVVAGYSGELNYRFLALSRRGEGYRMTPTPLFVGGGMSVSTVQLEAFTQLGFRNLEVLTKYREVFYVTLSSMTRVGTLMPSLIFDDLAGYYVSAQGSVGLHFAESSFPVALEFGVTGTSGSFLERGRDERDESTPLQPSLRERFMSAQATIGDFSFQTYNDLIAGKDKGPTYGASISYTLSRGLGWL
jgi:hypothetical protein